MTFQGQQPTSFLRVVSSYYVGKLFKRIFSDIHMFDKPAKSVFLLAIDRRKAACTEYKI